MNKLSYYIDTRDLPNNDLTYNGVTSEYVFQILAKSKSDSVLAPYVPVGIAYVNNMEYEGEAYLEWIEFLTPFRGKHLLGPVMKQLSSAFGKLYFEAVEGTEKKYNAIGAVAHELDADTGNMKYHFDVKEFN